MMLLFTTALIPHFLHDAESNTCLGTLAYLCVQGAAEPAAVAHEDLHGQDEGMPWGTTSIRSSIRRDQGLSVDSSDEWSRGRLNQYRGLLITPLYSQSSFFWHLLLQ